MIQAMAGIVDSGMNAKCTANVMASVCHAVFKECRQVEDETGQKLWLPSLLCRSECDRKKMIWDECVANIQADAAAAKAFETQMVALVHAPLLLFLYTLATSHMAYLHDLTH